MSAEGNITSRVGARVLSFVQSYEVEGNKEEASQASISVSEKSVPYTMGIVWRLRISIQMGFGR